MSSEVCPFCGKTYKRLKSHLPHCKVAASSKKPPTKHDVEANQTTSSHHLAAVSSKVTASGKKSMQMSTETVGLQTEKGEKVNASSTPANTSSSSQLTSSPLNSTSLPTSSKKKKQKLSDQIKAATLFSPTSPTLSPIVSKPKKQSLRALIEAAKSDQVKKRTLDGEGLPSDSTLSSRTKTKPGKDSVKDDASLSLLSADPKDASKKKMSKPKKVAQSSSITTHTSDFLDSRLNKSITRPNARDFWVDSEEEIEDSSANKLKSKITLQDVKSTLGRGTSPLQSSRPSVLNQIEATANQKDAVRCLVIPVTQSDQQLSSTSQHMELKPVKNRASKSKHPALFALLNAPSQPEPTSPNTAPLLSAQTSPPPRSVSLGDGLKVGHHVTGLLTVSPPLNQFCSPLPFPHAPQTLPVKVDGVEKLQLKVRNQNTAQHPTEGVLAQRSLGQVTLRDLPEWMACKTPSHPREVVEMVQRGWRWYYRRYIDVKKGSVAGLGMLLAGYCVISYIWSYPHIKLDRWRKHH
ncbi:uncharacterized protein C17orf80 homolog isoform X2 [Acanthochromis polyacanthus]|uniref:Uncharacterized protein n=1 Tax=Acanthochromis polyacanthus TaxID=80966 RepID=A0A3Q1F1T3_9TELE|nr:uncharacterized protein C17orf80 homolog isoform X2 [Acanthochromis polyacanthus]